MFLHLCKLISVGLKVVVTWQVLQQVLLTTGDTAEALMFEFPTHKSITSQFTGPVFEAIYNAFVPKYMEISTVKKNLST